jgi:hypothetical protein
LFVLEYKDRAGWIFGGAEDAYWTAVHFRRRFRFQNPLRQNYGHLKALEEYLTVPITAMFPLVVFRGRFEFKTPMPPGVAAHGYRSFLERANETVFDERELRRIVTLLEVAASNSGFLARREHARAVRARLDNDRVCPRCGSLLVPRLARTGRHAGKSFLGCSAYPACRFVQES